MPDPVNNDALLSALNDAIAPGMAPEPASPGAAPANDDGIAQTAQKLTQAIGQYEWRGNNSPSTYSRTNGIGAMGRYQFMPDTMRRVASAMVDKGLLDRVPTPKQFLNDPKLQDEIATYHTSDNLQRNLQKTGNLDDAVNLTAIDHYGWNGGRLSRPATHNGKVVGESPLQYVQNVRKYLGQTPDIADATATTTSGRIAEDTRAIDDSETPASAAPARPAFRPFRDMFAEEQSRQDAIKGGTVTQGESRLREAAAPFQGVHAYSENVSLAPMPVINQANVKKYAEGLPEEAVGQPDAWQKKQIAAQQELRGLPEAESERIFPPAPHVWTPTQPVADVATVTPQQRKRDIALFVLGQNRTPSPSDISSTQVAPPPQSAPRPQVDFTQNSAPPTPSMATDATKSIVGQRTPLPDNLFAQPQTPLMAADATGQGAPPEAKDLDETKDTGPSETSRVVTGTLNRIFNPDPKIGPEAWIDEVKNLDPRIPENKLAIRKAHLAVDEFNKGVASLQDGGMSPADAQNEMLTRMDNAPKTGVGRFVQGTVGGLGRMALQFGVLKGMLPAEASEATIFGLQTGLDEATPLSQGRITPMQYTADVLGAIGIGRVSEATGGLNRVQRMMAMGGAGAGQTTVSSLAAGQLPSVSQLVESGVTMAGFGGFHSAEHPASVESEAPPLPEAMRQEPTPQPQAAVAPAEHIPTPVNDHLRKVIDELLPATEQTTGGTATETQEATGPSAAPDRSIQPGIYLHPGAELPPVTHQDGQRVFARGLHMDVLAPKGEEIVLPKQEGEQFDQTYTPSHDVGVISDIGQTADHPVHALVGDTPSGRQVFVADMTMADGRTEHAIVGKAGVGEDGMANARRMLTETFGNQGESAQITPEKQGAVRLWFEHGDMTKPYAEQQQNIHMDASAKYGRSATRPTAEAAAEPATELAAPPEVPQVTEGAQDANTTGEQRQGDLTEHQGDHGELGGVGQDRNVESVNEAAGTPASTGDRPRERAPEQEKVAEPAESTPISPENKPEENQATVTDATQVGAAEPFGIRNKLTDAARRDRDMPVREPGKGTSFAEARAQALDTLKDDPAAGVKLVDAINKKPFAPSAEQDALLTHELQERQRQFDKAADDLNAAPDGQKDAAYQKMTEAQEHYQKALDASAKSGTASSDSLRLRQMLVDDEFTLAKMHSRARVVRKGRTLTPEEFDAVRAAHEEIRSKSAAADNAAAAANENFAHEHVQNMLREMRESGKREADATREDIKQAVKKGTPVADFFQQQADKARERMKGRAGSLHAEILPGAADALDMTIIGASHIAKGLHEFGKWSKAMLSDIGEHIKGKLEQLYQDAQAYHDIVAGEFGAPKSKRRSVEEIKAGIHPGELDGKTIYELAKAHAQSGVTDPKELFDKVTDDLRATHPDITVRDVRDAYSGYGKVRHPSKDAILQQLGQARTWARLASSIEDAESGVPPKRTGYQRQKPSTDIRADMAKLRQIMRDNDIQVTSPEEQLKSALDAAKTRARNAIEDINREIETGEKKAKAKGIEPDQELKDLYKQRDDLAAQRDEIFGANGLTDAQRVDMAIKAAERTQAEYERRTRERDFTKKEGPPLPMTPELRAARAKADIAKKVYGQLKDEAFPKKTEAERYHDAIDKRIADLDKKRLAKDFTKKSPVQRDLDEKTQQSLIDLERARKSYRATEAEEQKKLQTRSQRYTEKFVEAQRSSKLTGIPILAKLGMAGVSRPFLVEPLEGTVGALVSKAFPAFAARAQREGLPSIGEAADAQKLAMAAYVKQGMQEAWQHLHGKNSDLDIQFGGPDDLRPDHWLSLPGHMHAAIKAPTKRAELTRSLALRTTAAAKAGRDVESAAVKDELEKAAYKDAKRAIYMQDNFIANKFSGLVQMMVNDKKHPVAGRVSAATMRTLLPFVKVSSNIVGEAFNYAGGLAPGLVRMAHAYVKGVEHLDPEIADAIMRQIKKGSLGAALILTGWAAPEAFGGLKEHGKHKDGELRADHIQFFDDMLNAVGGDAVVKTFGSTLSHTPPFMMLQLGAAIRKAQEKYLIENGSAHTLAGARSGAITGMLDLVAKAPFADAITRIAPVLEGESGFQKYFGGVVSGLVPGVASNTAKWMDSQDKAPDGIGDQILQNVPLLRSGVPNKPVPKPKEDTGEEKGSPFYEAQKHARPEVLAKRFRGFTASEKEETRDLLLDKIDRSSLPDEAKDRLLQVSGNQ